MWTVAIAFSMNGFIGGIVAFFLPVLAELFWYAKIGHVAGFDSLYCIATIASGVLYVAVFMSLFLKTLFVVHESNSKFSFSK